LAFLFRSLGYLTQEGTPSDFKYSVERLTPISRSANTIVEQAVAVTTPVSQVVIPTAVTSTPATSTPVASIPQSEPQLTEVPGVKLAWNQLMLEVSWKSGLPERDEWLKRLGATGEDALEFITAAEVDELEGLLTPIPFRRFKKYMGIE
jgi:hypothetical protein